MTAARPRRTAERAGRAPARKAAAGRGAASPPRTPPRRAPARTATAASGPAAASRASPRRASLAPGRTATLRRKTKETTVRVTLALNGSGRYDVATDNPFLSHMLETWARYAGFDLTVRATGDLDHHLVEDVAITLGQAFRKAFAHTPCVRIAYDFVPMDDALVLCAVDLVDRPHYAGELPVPLWDHFFRSFAMEARINLHLEHLRGRDTHHTTEAAVKAFARALHLALAPRGDEISTKGAVRTTLAGAPPAGRRKGSR